MKKYIIIAGPNGAGKSTIANSVNDFCGYDYINLDAIVRTVQAKDEIHRFTQATEIAVEKIDENFRKNISFVQESTLSGKSIISNIRRAKAAEYKVIIHFIGVDSVSICKKRIARRVAAGGHGIPDPDVERRYKRSFEALKKLIGEIDELYLYDNSKRFRKIAKYVSGKCIWKSDDLPKWYNKIDDRKGQ